MSSSHDDIDLATWEDVDHDLTALALELRPHDTMLAMICDELAAAGFDVPTEDEAMEDAARRFPTRTGDGLDDVRVRLGLGEGQG